MSGRAGARGRAGYVSPRSCDACGYARHGSYLCQWCFEHLTLASMAATFMAKGWARCVCGALEICPDDQAMMAVADYIERSWRRRLVGRLVQVLAQRRRA